MMARRLTADERRLWGAVMATVTPLRRAGHQSPTETDAAKTHPVPVAQSVSKARVFRSQVEKNGASPSSARTGRGVAERSANTLDGGWDKRLARGVVTPDASIDLHGHSLSSAHAMLDAGLARSIARDDRVLLLVTGKPPKPDSERPHARGAIRAAVADWLAASRHADRIAAVRPAHPRHGGGGALYIVLRRARTPA